MLFQCRQKVIWALELEVIHVGHHIRKSSVIKLIGASCVGLMIELFSTALNQQVAKVKRVCQKELIDAILLGFDRNGSRYFGHTIVPHLS